MRPLLHSAVAFKIDHALDEIARLADPALHDWLLERCEVESLASSTAWNWKHDDVCILSHPVLESDVALRVLAQARTPLADRLRADLTRLGCDANIAAVSGLPGLRKLRILAREPESLWDWRHAMASKGAAVPLRGASALAALTRLEHLTIIGAAGIDLAALAALPALHTLELVACDVEALPLGASRVRELVIASCLALRSLELPRQLETLRIDDAPVLASIGTSPAQTVEITGAPLLAPAPRKTRSGFERY